MGIGTRSVGHHTLLPFEDPSHPLSFSLCMRIANSAGQGPTGGNAQSQSDHALG